MKAYQYFTSVYSLNSLAEIYTNYVQQSAVVGHDGISRKTFEQRREEELEIIKRKVIKGTYRFTPYKQKLISKGADKFPRVISIPTIRDKVTLRALCNLLFEVYREKINLEIPQIKIEKIKKAIKKKRFDSFIKIDVTNFYPSIRHEHLEKALKGKIRKAELRSLIYKSLKNPTVAKPQKGNYVLNEGGVPQGLSTSNILAEILLIDIDSYYNSKRDIRYYRYVDDILILCRGEDKDEISESVVEELRELGLEAHELGDDSAKSCCGPLSGSFSYLGYRFENRLAKLGAASIHRFESSIASILTAYKYRYQEQGNLKDKNRALAILKWRLNIRITGCIFEGKKRGWVFYFSQINDLSILYQLDDTIAKMIRRFGLQDKLRPKRLIKTLHEAQRKDKSSHRYIVNFDDFDTTQKRQLMEMYVGKNRLRDKTDDEIDRLFKVRIRKVIEELEVDLQEFS